ncbi:MAG: nitroreductase family protein [Nitrospirae bacterium]|nr:nitroreductase family protein [Nitrospirota bacterium]
MTNFSVNKERCLKCGECIEDCVMNIIAFEGQYPAIIPGKENECVQCEHCFAVCSEGAVSILGLNPDNAIRLEGNLPETSKLEVLMKGRRAVRRYLKKPVPWETISGLLDVVANSPTGRNTRQNLFTVVSDPLVMDKIKQETMEGVRSAVANYALPKGFEFYSFVVDAWDAGKDIIFRGAPHMLVVSSPKDGPSPEADTLIALTYFELLAQSMGIGTLWNGLLKWAVTAVVPELRKKIGIPEDHYIGYCMVFGRPAVRYYRTVQRGPALINRVTSLKQQ